MDRQNLAFLEARGINSNSKNGLRWRLLIAVVTVICVYVMVMIALVPPHYDIAVGGLMPTTVYASRKVEDVVTTQDRKSAAAEQVSNKYSVNETVTSRSLKEFKDYYQALIEGRNIAYENATYNSDGDLQLSSGALERANEVFMHNLSGESVRTLLSFSQEEILTLFASIETELSSFYKDGVYEEDVDMVKSQILLAVPTEQESLKNLVTLGLDKYLTFNMFYDETATENERQKARDQVEPIFYAKGQVIAYAGETISESQYEVLYELGILGDTSRLDLAMVGGALIMVTTIFVLYYLYLFIFSKPVYQSIKYFFLTNLILLITIGICVFVLGWREFLMPIALGGLLTTTLIDKKIAVMTNLVVCGIIALIQREAWSAFAVYTFLISGTAGIYVLARQKSRFSVISAGFVTGAVCFIMNVAYSFIAEKSTAISFTPALYSVGNTAVATVLCIGLTILFEGTFHVLTPSVLLELGNTENRLLKELIHKAPGTYQHSVAVATLAEAAADDIGANGLLARVAAYYHDIGKTPNPEFFKENQYGPNIHDQLQPEESAKILIAHTTEGLKMAKKERLPREIAEITTQHHGTTITKYFYDKALELGREVDIENFRYPGPKPQTKEAGIIMLADTLEAAMRLDYDEKTARRRINDMVYSKVQDGQMDECDLTFKDIQKIIDSFEATFRAIYHKRIAYKQDDPQLPPEGTK